MKLRNIISSTILLAGGLLLIGSMATAGNPQPTPKPKVQKKSGPKTLGEIAAGIKLEGGSSTAEGTQKEGVVIDNSNLKEMGKGAVISEGGSLAPSSSSAHRSSEGGDESVEGNGPEANKDEIDKLEAQLEAIRKAEKENKRVNMYNGAGPQYRSPGTKDPLEQQRKDLEAQLKAAKAGQTAPSSGHHPQN